MNKQVVLAFSLIFLSFNAFAQGAKKRVLFLGNSYTERNNLPQIIANIADSRGDTLVFDSNAPSSFTLLLHAGDATSLDKIRLGNWDFVVLQEQSQRPALSQSEVDTKFFPYARSLDNLINSNNPCGETVFYMTWGRKTGDIENCGTYPPVCTYTGMDDLLRLRYLTAADNNKGVVSPVGPVWRYIRQYYPNIELYNADESHPSVSGSFAAACCFYTCLFRKNPLSITYNHGLTEAEANNIKTAVKTVVFDSLSNWRIETYDPKAQCNFTVSTNNTNTVTFNNLSTNATQYLWEFGDGTTATTTNPVHTYSASGNYIVKLTASRCKAVHTVSFPVNTGTIGIELLDFKVKRNESSVLLMWTTASEKDNSVFHIEHSLNGTGFQTIGQVKGHGTTAIPTSYRFEHTTPSVGVNYYRLKQVDFNGSATFSPIRLVVFDKKGWTISSTIVKDVLNITVSDDLMHPLSINVFNSAGQQVLTAKIQGQQSLNISHLSNGLYIIRTATGEMGRFVKI